MVTNEALDAWTDADQPACPKPQGPAYLPFREVMRKTRRDA